MSLPGRIPNTAPYLETSSASNQQQNERPPVTHTNIAQNALQAHASAANTLIAASTISDPGVASNIQTVAHDVFTPPLARRPLRDILNKWVGNDDNKTYAATRILNCIRDRSLILHLECSGITSLPDIFDYPELNHLRELLLNDNRLTALPSSIGQLTALQLLNVSDNHLRTLPSSIGQLTALQVLSLNCNQLTVLPDAIGQLTTLQGLYLDYNQLTVLPDAVGQLTALQWLYLNNNRLTTLPESIGQLTALYRLCLSNNLLTILPVSIGQLTALCSLNLENNFFSALPESMSQLTALRRLLLHNNPLRELPHFLRTLNLHVHDLPFAVNIESITEEICRVANVKPSEALKQLYEKATDGANGQKALLRAWIGKLKDTAPGKSRDVHFYKSIVQILELASTNALFAETFWIVIADAATTCGDRIALSILDLDIARQLMTLDPQKHLQVADFLKRGVWTYNLLKTQAMNKILELRAEINHRPDLTKRQKKELIERIEEIEIYLGYFIKLKEALNLPITMQEMLYFTCSTLTNADLGAARTHIIAQLSNDDAYAGFLIGQDKWKETLKVKRPEELESIEKAYAESEEEADVALETYHTALKELTRNLLSEPETNLVEGINQLKIEDADNC